MSTVKIFMVVVQLLESVEEGDNVTVNVKAVDNSRKLKQQLTVQIILTKELVVVMAIQVKLNY